MPNYTVPCKAIISFSNDDWRLEDVLVREPEQGELLVKTFATGVCHTDVQNVGGIYPRILGHEGAGIVEKVHPSVNRCSVGDLVLLSFPRCTECHMCLTGNPAYCHVNGQLTIHAKEPSYALAQGENEMLQTDSQGRKRVIAASYFGQSSLSSISLVKETSVVVANNLIKDRSELGLFAPLGCGLQTGACSITNVAKAGKDDCVAIIGLGAVGLAALVAAKNSGVTKIIAVDRIQSRIDIAMQLGATHSLDTATLSKLGFAAAIGSLSLFATSPEDDPSLLPGPSVIVDTTGIPSILQEALIAVAPLGRVVQITSPGPGSRIEIDLVEHMRKGVSFTGTIQGNADPYESIPRLVQWYKEGKLPLEKIEKTFPAEKFQEALDALHNGSVVKAVLLW